MTDKARNILIIEDNREVLEGIMDTLEYGGYHAEGLIRFNESEFELLKTKRFQLIILDIMLSGADGRDLARKFKNTQEIKDTPILMISAYTDVKNSVLKAGADNFLQKPFGLRELLEKVEQYVKSKA